MELKDVKQFILFCPCTTSPILNIKKMLNYTFSEISKRILLLPIPNFITMSVELKHIGGNRLIGMCG